MTRRVAEIDLARDVENASRAVSLLKWIAPKGLDSIRAELRETVESGGSKISRWDYEDIEDTSGSEITRRLRADLGTSDVDGAILQLVDSFLQDQSEAIEVVRGRDDDQFTDWSVRKYGLPVSALSEAARSCVDLPREAGSEVPNVDAGGALLEVEELLDNLGLAQDWVVRTSNQMAARMSVLPLSRQISIRSDVAFSRSEIRRLLAHEVFGHVLRSEFSQRQTNPWAMIPLGSAAATEEGLAAWTEAHLDVSSLSTRQTYALRLLAVNLAQMSGIVGVVNSISQFTDIASAVDIAIRVKRGLRDPNRPGGFVKDHIYFSGYEEVSRALDINPDDYELLMATKWGTDTLPVVRDLVRDGDLSTWYTRKDLEAARQYFG